MTHRLHNRVDSVNFHTRSYLYIYTGVSATAVAAGGDHTCALLSGGRVVCWGSNDFGQLGIGNNIDVDVPASVNLGAGL